MIDYQCSDATCGYTFATITGTCDACPVCGEPVMDVTLKNKGMPQVGASLKPKKKSSLKVTVQALPTLAATQAAKQAELQQAVSMTMAPSTQKAKGIKVLQSAGMLSTGQAIVALTELQAITAAQSIGIPCFVRPCPITPRHGFVDSRVVQTLQEVRDVWGEARQADPQAELIVMPFITATHNMVWRPGLLSVGPGHDGATGGHDSVSIFLQPGYSQSWRNLATKAGVKVDSQDPFVEAVASNSTESVLTQIRAGVKGSPTAPDWNPHAGMTIVTVVPIDNAHKSDPGAMLAWEVTAKTLKPGQDVVWNPGGNLGDHWSVHAQLANVTVITSYKPAVGAVLAKVGEDLVPLEPQAILFGYLGGLLSPSLSLPVSRKRAVCAALLGSHHGMRMGGDSGVFIGASVAMMLRLAQAAIWGEARHKDHGKGLGKGLSRDQIYKGILDKWELGREGLEAKGALFLTASWAGGYGGQAWAACAEATCVLDATMLELVKMPSRVNAKKVLACLTNVVNLAHNNGWWLNKFATTDVFNMAADLDPRVAMLAGPVWYESTLAPIDVRMELLGRLEGMQPINLAKYGKVTAPKSAAPKKKSIVDQLLSLDSMPTPSLPTPTPAMKKVGEFDVTPLGGKVNVGACMKAQAKIASGTALHVQLQVGTEGQYVSGKIVCVSPGGLPPTLLAALEKCPQSESLGGTGQHYALLFIDGHTIELPLYGPLATF